MKIRLFTSIAILLSTPLHAGDTLRMAVSPLQSFAPANVVVRVQIAPDAANRALEIVAESDDYYRSSRIQVDGDEAPRTRSLEFRNLPSGDYDVRATLIDSTGRERAAAYQHVIVVSAIDR